MASVAGILSRIYSSVSESPVVDRGKKVASNTFFVAKKLLKTTGKAAWIVTTTFLVLYMPLMIETQAAAERLAEAAAEQRPEVVADIASS